jgi:hypothetical protein
VKIDSLCAYCVPIKNNPLIINLLGGRLVGIAGFEPTTSWSQTRHSNRAELHPDAVREGFEPSVQLPVRQFSKLVVSATHPSHLLIFPLTELWDGKDRFSKRTLQIDVIFFTKLLLSRPQN